MPLYEYQCKGCKKSSEILVFNRSDEVCPHCGGKKLSKQMSTFAVSGTGKKVKSSSNGCGHCHGGNCSSCG